MTAQILNKTSAGLRLRLIAMIVLLVGPLAVFQAFELAQVKSTRTRLTQQQAYDLAKAGAARYQDMIDQARSVLELLSRVAEVTGGGEQTCSGFLTEVVRSHAWARSMFVGDGSNKVVCATISGGKNFDFSEREWFKEARANGAFSISNFVVSKVTGQPSAFASFFFRNAKTGEQNVIAAELDLKWIDRLSASVGERDDSLVMLTDGFGVVISQFPAATTQRFARLPQNLMQRMTEATTTLFAGVDADGKERLFGSFPLTGAKGRVIVGLDRAAAVGLIDKYIVIAASFFTGLTLLASLIVWFIGDRIFVRPVEILNSLLKTTLDTMDQGLIAIDRHGRADVINMRAMMLLDLPVALATVRPHQDEILKFQNEQGEFTNPDEFAQVTKDITQRRRGTYERRRPNGTVLEVRTVPTKDGGFVRTYSDITRRSEAEANLVREKESAVAASLAATEFLTNMSHELRTPLTAIIGVSEMLLNGEPSPDEQQRFMQMQKHAGQALLSVINDILDFSKIEARQLHLESEPFDLHQAINDCISIIIGSARQKGLLLSFEVAATVPVWVRGDAERLKQVLLNLLSNAVKFTKAGLVDLRVEASGSSGSPVRFVIADSGVGIASEDLPRIFERFAQADSSTTRRFGGTGLGLAISKKLVLLMGGDFDVASQPLKGSTFAFTAPFPACDRPVLDRPQERRTHTPRRLLLAEDNKLNRQLIQAMLEQAGHQVEVVNDGVKAVQAASLGHFDAILMDIQMPELDGYSAASIIRSNFQGRVTPIIALTANAVSDEAERCFEAGMDAYFSKPINWAGLLETIDRLVDDGHQQQFCAKGREPPSSGIVPILNTDTLNRIQSSIGPRATTNLLSLFIVEARQQFTTADFEADEVRREAHSFGGSAAMLGLERLAQACAMLSTGDFTISYLAVNIDTCRVERDHAIAVIQSILKARLPAVRSTSPAKLRS